MLEPDARHLLLDALRPPAGYTLDAAVGTTYTLDLLALMTAPVAFAIFDRQRADGSPAEDPIATLQALREHAGRITLFCQAGQIAVPPEFRSLLVYLEQSVYPVVPPKPSSIFHPKVWFIRFREPERDTVRFRLLCLSRNLTFDRSWDTVLRLDGEPGDLDAEPVHPELAAFADALVAMAAPVRPLAAERAETVRALGRDMAAVRWTLPGAFDTVRFWPLGHHGQDRWPFHGRMDRMLIVSPFLTEHALSRITTRRDSILVSRPESLDRVGGKAVRRFAETLVLSSDAAATPEAADTATLATADHWLEGLHAKLYVADAPYRGRVWTGSANATDAAFGGNVEFLVEMEGRKDRCGVDATIAERTDRLGMRKLVEPYVPQQDQGIPPTDAEQIEQRLDVLRRVVGGLRFTTTCEALPDGRWRMTLNGSPGATRLDPNQLEGVAVTVRPATIGGGAAVIPALGEGLSATFDVSEPAVTPYFAINLTIEEVNVAFVVASELIGGPAGRAERVLSSLLKDPAALLRFLLLLLGNVDEALDAFGSPNAGGAFAGDWLSARGSDALLEPLVRAFARNPDRLRDVERVIAELARVDGSAEILPPRWHEIWDPIAEALAAREAAQ